MKILTKLRNMSVSQNYCKITQTRNKHFDRFFSYRAAIRPKPLEKIPDFQELWMKYYSIIVAENYYKKIIFDELVSECNLKINPEMHYLEKLLLVESDVGTLIKHKFIPSASSIVKGLLSHLQYFPFHNKLLINKENINSLSIKLIRDVIEDEFLMWKFKVDLNQLKEIKWRYRFCLFEYRSMTTLQKNIQELEKLPKSSQKCVAEKIYHINQMPFSVTSYKRFKLTIGGLNLNLFSEYCPRLLKYSQRYIVFVISTLKRLGFTDKQIQVGLPFLNLNFVSLLRRLNGLLTHPEIVKHRNEDKFLWLLSLYPSRLHDLTNLKKTSFEELTEFISVSKSHIPSIKFTTLKSIDFYINQYFEIDNYTIRRILRKYQRYKVISKIQIEETLIFLKNLHCTSKEVEESLPIILYPRNSIAMALEKINEEANTLKNCGFKKGFISEESHFFSGGTKEKNKLLQLCLYYLEKPSDLSQSNIYDDVGSIDSEHI